MLQNFINNASTPSTSSETIDLINPVTGEVTGQSPKSNQADVDAAYAAAQAATKT